MAVQRTVASSVIFLLSIEISSSSLPNIFLLLIDDLGWNDLSLHGGCDYPTPNLDALAKEGLQLNNYYTQHICTPTRHSLLSGRYPISDGMQESSIGDTQPYGMPLDLVTLPEMLKTSGKWHLGFCLLDFTPTRRGFDTHLGYWGDGEDYYAKNNTWDSMLSGTDFRNQTASIFNADYSTYIYGNETLQILQDHVADDNEDPFFIYFSSQAVHTPWSAPDNVIDYFIETMTTPEGAERAKLAAVATVLDNTIGRIVDYMKSEESGYLWDNTLFIVSSDNGGPVERGGSNFPLRGDKMTLWEGGIKVPAFVTGGLLPNHRRGESMDALMHISDWFPTLCDLAGIDYEMEGVQELDGFSQLDNILNGESNPYEPRELLVHNIQPNGCSTGICGALRWKNWKIVVGDEVDFSGDEACKSTWCPLYIGWYSDSMTIQCTNEGDFNYPAVDFALDCPYNGYPCLFDIESDPCEYNDLRESEPEIYEKMYDLLLQYNATQKLPTLWSIHSADVDGANPALYGGYWSPWKEVEPDLGASTTDAASNGELLDVVEGKRRRRMSNLTLCTMGVIILIIAALAIKMLLDCWTQYSYRKIGDGTDRYGNSSI